MAWLRLLSAAGLTQFVAILLRKLGRCIAESVDGVGVRIGLKEHVYNRLVASARGQVERGPPGEPTGGLNGEPPGGPNREPTIGQIVGPSAIPTE